MDAGQFWALIWVLSLVGLVSAGLGGNAVIEKSPWGYLTFAATCGLVVGTFACVWIAAGLNLSLGIS